MFHDQFKSALKFYTTSASMSFKMQRLPIRTMSFQLLKLNFKVGNGFYNKNV